MQRIAGFKSHQTRLTKQARTRKEKLMIVAEYQQKIQDAIEDHSCFVTEAKRHNAAVKAAQTRNTCKKKTMSFSMKNW